MINIYWSLDCSWSDIFNLCRGVERNIKSNSFFGTSKTWMPCIDRPGTHVIKAQGRTIIVCFRSFATEFVQAVSIEMAFIAKLFGKAPSIKMSPSLAVFMDQAAIGKLGPEFVIELWKFFKGYIIKNS